MKQNNSYLALEAPNAETNSYQDHAYCPCTSEFHTCNAGHDFGRYSYPVVCYVSSVSLIVSLGAQLARHCSAMPLLTGLGLVLFIIRLFQLCAILLTF